MQICGLWGCLSMSAWGLSCASSLNWSETETHLRLNSVEREELFGVSLPPGHPQFKIIDSFLTFPCNQMMQPTVYFPLKADWCLLQISHNIIGEHKKIWNAVNKILVTLYMPPPATPLLSLIQGPGITPFFTFHSGESTPDCPAPNLQLCQPSKEEMQL